MSGYSDRQFRRRVRNCIPFATEGNGVQETQECMDWMESRIAELVAEIQKEIAQLNRALDRIEAQPTKEVA